MSLNYDDYLEHYGVKGMKWGVKKSKADRKADRGRIKENFKKNYSLKNKQGKVSAALSIASMPLLGPAVASAVAGSNLAEAAGYKKGTSVAIGIVAGAPGGLIASEVAVRRRQLG